MFPTRRRATTLMLGSALALGGLGTATGCDSSGNRAPGTAKDADATPARPRHVALRGAVNLRDLGGYRTADGRRVRYGRLFRSDALAKLTPADVTELAGLRLHTVVDLRVPEEREFDGPDRLPPGLKATVLPVDDKGLFEAMQSAIASKDPAAQRRKLGGGRAARRMREIYPGFVSRPGNREQFARIIHDVADERRLPLLFHCTSGKDRTGWLSYVLLRILGVPHATAERDYLLSNTFRRPADAKVRAGLEKSGMMRDPERLLPLQEVRAEYLAAGLDEVRKEYGGLDGYLRRGLDLDRATLNRVRARMLT